MTTAETRPDGLVIPPAPSRLLPTVVSIVVGVVILASARGLGIAARTYHADAGPNNADEEGEHDSGGRHNTGAMTNNE